MKANGLVRLRSPGSVGRTGRVSTPISRVPFSCELVAPPLAIWSKTSVSWSPRKIEMIAGGASLARAGGRWWPRRPKPVEDRRTCGRSGSPRRRTPGTGNRLPPDVVRRLQPPRGARHDARLASGSAVMGSGAARSHPLRPRQSKVTVGWKEACRLAASAAAAARSSRSAFRPRGDRAFFTGSCSSRYTEWRSTEWPATVFPESRGTPNGSC